MTTEALATRDAQPLALRHELTVEEIVAQAAKIKAVMQQAMEVDVHFGTIPGTPKPTLYKAGAEKLCLLFRFDPQYQSVETHLDGGHLAVKTTCTLWHITTGVRMGSGEGSCSTREAKYAWRFSKRACPSCNTEAISKSAEQYGGGWYCNRKAGGCGANFKPGSDGAKAIESQREVGKVPNPDLADQYNTVLKMANKRALVAAVLNCTAASDVFTQDLEDEDEDGGGGDRRQRGGSPSSEGPAEGPINDAQGKRLWAIAREQLWSQDEVKALLGTFGIEHTKDIPRSKYESIVNKIKAEKKSPPPPNGAEGQQRLA